jgi:hypothetical protein
MIDFTLTTYNNLLSSLKNCGYSFQSYKEFIQFPENKTIILRHDVDRLPEYSLETAQIEHSLGITGSYYFRALPVSFNEEIIKKIGSFGHEIGYHYEDLALCHGDIQKAYSSFCRNLEKLRMLQPVVTITMHGSPVSKWDNRDLWNYYNYKELGLLGEPYFDLDFKRILQLTDTGRHWNNFKLNVRDKSMKYSPDNKHEKFQFHSTGEIIDMAKANKLPLIIMMSTHPQRWTNNMFSWTNELLFQSIKNIVKRRIVSLQTREKT